MTALWDEKERRPIPRWRTSRATLIGGELASFLTHPRSLDSTAEAFLKEKRRMWERNRDVPSAAEFVGACLVTGDYSSGVRAAEHLLSEGSDATPDLRSVAARLLSIADAEPGGRAASTSLQNQFTPPRERIRFHRDLVHKEPRNALAWTDLSLAYAVLGLAEKAREAMDVALRLAAGNRFVLRAASRLFLHLDEPDRAHDLLRKAERTAYDPWLAAAEIAVSSVAGRKSKLAKRAEGMLRAGDLPPSQTTELSSALGTLELYSGRTSAAKKLLRLSLTDPNDNSVAQATWAARRIGGFQIELGAFDTPRSFEARALRAFEEGRWEDSVSACREWLFDEPFSSRPAELASFIGLFVLQKSSDSERIIREALIANPTHWALRNNLAVALAQQGQVQAASTEFARIPTHGHTESFAAVLEATRGLISFRSGHVAEGRRHYNVAIYAFEALSPRSQRIAAVLLAEEEVRARTDESAPAIAYATELIGPGNEADVLVALARVKNLSETQRLSEASVSSANEERRIRR